MKFKYFDIDNNKELDSLDFLMKESENFNPHNFYLLNKKQQSDLRSGNAATLNRARMTGGGAKPYKQKGTGRARRGTNKSPLRRGGAVIFGPQPRNYESKLNQTQIKNTILEALSKKSEQISFVKTDLVNTKKFSCFIKGDSNVLVIIDSLDSKLFMSARNIDVVNVSKINNLPLGKLLAADRILISDACLDTLKEML